MSSSTTETLSANERCLELEKQVSGLRATSDRKDLEILELKNSMIEKNKEVMRWKNTCGSRDEQLKQLTKQLRGKDEDNGLLRRELGDKEYEIRSLESSQPPVPSKPSPARQSNSNEYNLNRCIEDLVRDHTQAANTNKYLREKDVEHQDAIKRLKHQLE